MIDLNALRADPQRFRNAWQDRGESIDVDALLALDAKVRESKVKTEGLRAEVNAASKAIGAVAKQGAAALEAAKA